jgi:deoxyribodipyrimidine photo-lyase
MARFSLVWFRKDLRLSDNPALDAAVSRGAPILCVFIRDETTEGALPVGAAAAWWLHHSLTALADSLTRIGGRLVLRSGDPRKILPALCAEHGIDAVFWNRCYEPAAIKRDTTLKADLKAADIAVESFNGSLLREPWEVKTKAGGPYGVFTPFWKAERALGDPDAPRPAPRDIEAVAAEGDDLADWSLLPTEPDWAGGLRDAWTPGEAGARERLDVFLGDGVARYAKARNRPDQDGTSRLGPHLAFGEVSPREIWHIALDRLRSGASSAETGIWSFLRELGWRDFNHNLLYHNPGLPTENHNAKFDAFAWRTDAEALAAWRRGRTGYPMVDAGMRELWHTGFMHNRVRMVVASFLVKHLLIDWRAGEAWFRDTLVDADLANNTANWQWTAGCGADAAPYFRIFNPMTQGEKFDPDGAYIRRWVPELADLPDKYLNQPWDASPEILARAGIALGDTYPNRLVAHTEARKRALDAYEEIKGAA